MKTEISLCKKCYCMTYTLPSGRCGKCNKLKRKKKKEKRFRYQLKQGGIMLREIEIIKK